ncbi:secretion protein HlyD family protein [Novosphingobium nitrogenifigens DSM 19370]|uniref:Secretion protein HlyD family protein n=1 Tax=Novosphingobium nitrogenifigens DSM 19370 TaxID=983920 RepID=F1Z3A6_9SPHN|nr:HlyD family secretion protein [Novosphingobium nitrogenifigens]EGD60906.1 secretion protein HlyD family protein [Novosphingobium nitrogenifigens DSM 19370]
MPFAKPLVLAGAAACLLAGGAIAADRYFAADGPEQTTNDAYVEADFTTVAPKVAGRIDKVLVEDNEMVRPGQVLAHIEDDDFRAALTMAQGDVAAMEGNVARLKADIARQQAVIDAARATVRADEADLVFARQNRARYSHLAEGGASPQELRQGAEAKAATADATRAHDQAEVSNATGQIAVLKAQLQQAEGQLDKARGAEQQARLNLSYCTIQAPVFGRVGARGLRVGAYVQAGTGLLAVVPTQAAYVVANFQETQLTRIRPGQQASVWVDTFPGKVLHAHVDSVAPASEVAFSPIKPDNATGNFTKVIQRIPVKLTFDPGQPLAAMVRVGMSVEAKIDTAAPANGAHAGDERYAWH